METLFKRLDEPLPLGHCNVVSVVKNSVDGLEGRRKTENIGFKIGDRVVSNGPHTEMVRVWKNLCAKIPDNVSDETSAFTVPGGYWVAKCATVVFRLWPLMKL